MKITLIVPLVSIVAFKYPSVGVVLGMTLILINILLNMHYTYVHDLKIGFLDIHNYYLLQSIVAKPWSKLQNVAQGVFTAMIYMRILHFRTI